MYPSVTPDELARHATEVGRVLVEAGIVPADRPRHGLPPTFFKGIRLTWWLHARCLPGFQRVGRGLVEAVCEGLLYYHLLSAAWLLVGAYFYQALEDLCWDAPWQSDDDSLGSKSAKTTQAARSGLGQLVDLFLLL